MDRDSRQRSCRYNEDLNGLGYEEYLYSHSNTSAYHEITPSSEFPSQNIYGYLPNLNGCEASIGSIPSVLPAHSGSGNSTPFVGTRVHVNPNFRPKHVVRRDKESVMQRPANVHINPHWKGKVEPIIHPECNGQESIGPGRKTIFINPKMLALINSSEINKPQQLGIIPSSRSGTSDCCGNVGNVQDVFYKNLPHTSVLINESVDSVKSKKSQPSVTTSEHIQEKEVQLTVSEKLVKTETVKNPMINHTSGILHTNATKSSSNSVLFNMKMAKLVCSKYKLVRNAPLLSSSPKSARLGSANVWRSSRRKSFNMKLTNVVPSKPSFKYVRNRESYKLNRESSRFRLVNKSKTRIDHQNCSPRLLSSQTDMKETVRDSNSGNKIVKKSRYKLVKVSPLLSGKNTPALTSESRSKKLTSRYKLVRTNSSGFQSKVKSTGLTKGRSQTVTSNRPQTLPNSSSAHQHTIKSHFKLVRCTSQNRMLPSSNVSRYRFLQTSVRKSKRRILQSSSKSSLHVRCASLQFNGGVRGSWPYFYGNRIWHQGRLLQQSQAFVNNHKLLCTSSSLSPKRRGSLETRPKALLNIGGVLYQSTPTTLTRARSTGSSKCEKVLHIRGRKFVLDSKGLTLRPMVDSCEMLDQKGLSSCKPISRVDIGGVTFLRRSGNTLVRTNGHHARTLLSVAKMKSIALLSDKLRKNNQPCLIYHRFGKCHAHDNGKCWRVHDPKNICICQKFLQGRCDIKGCLLSHNIGPEKMPTCRYFLDGCCVRDNCPYLHVKVSARAAICRKFLDGYCAAGNMCEKRHVNICPDFDQDGKCPKGKHCPYRHPKHSSPRIRIKKPRSAASIPKDKARKVSYSENFSVKDDINSNEEKRKRYYDEEKSPVVESPEAEQSGKSSLNEKRQRIFKQIDHLKKIRLGVFDDVEGCVSSLNNAQERELAISIYDRPKLGILPSYIPLE